MALTYTYDTLLTIAAREVALRRDALDSEESTLLNTVPNQALERLALMREWPSLIAAMTLTATTNQAYILLPTDFLAFNPLDQLNYSSGAGLGPLSPTELHRINGLRAMGTSTGQPYLYALDGVDGSGANKGRYRIQLYPTPGSGYTLIGSYRRVPTALSLTSDVPEFPLALHPALAVATRIAARETFGQETPRDLEQLLDKRVNEAAAVLLRPTPHDTRPLRNLRGMPADNPGVRNREADLSGIDLV